MEKLTYEAAAAELNQILTALKNEEITVDELAEKVERASQLILFCKKKLTTTEEKIEKIIDKLEQ
ncbi:exodeoxyribonuclease VII small subunit [Myroides sp. DW712]|uniref:exodeoxyribonuclease VII small subunit n=1 Tax=Myroides sp. DW712 TaxID=3389800 RepID=UPI00397A985C